MIHLFLLILTSFQVQANCPQEFFCAGDEIMTLDHQHGFIQSVDPASSTGMVSLDKNEIAIEIPLNEMVKHLTCENTKGICVGDLVLIEQQAWGMVIALWNNNRGVVQIKTNQVLGIMQSFEVGVQQLTRPAFTWGSFQKDQFVTLKNGKNFQLITLFPNGQALARRYFLGMVPSPFEQLIDLRSVQRNL